MLKSELCDKMKREFFQIVEVSLLLYGRTSTKHLERKLDGNYTRILHTVFKISWKYHPTKQQLNSHLLQWFVVGFYGISTFVGYLMPNPFLYK